MAEVIDKNISPAAGKDNAPVSTTQMAAPDNSAINYSHTQIKGRWDQFRSPYWGLAMGALGIRYLTRPLTRQFWDQNPAQKYSYPLKFAYAGVAGLIMELSAFYYARQTAKDIRNIFSETVAVELDKKPEDVTMRDLWKSDNTIVHQTCKNFLKMNARRIGINLLFIVPFIPVLGKRFFNNDYLIEKKIAHAETPLDLGVAGNSLYLVNDIVRRKITFFEQLQGFIDAKINHTDRVGEMITPADLISLYDRNAKDRNPKYTVTSRMDTPRWKNDQVLFGRMAGLMNQTYGNMDNVEQANFTIPKMLFLLGNGLIDPEKMESSLAFIEVANKYGMDVVKTLTKEVSANIDLHQAMENFPIPASVKQENTIAVKNAVEQETSADQAASAFANRPENQPRTPRTPVPAATHAERAAKGESLIAQGV